MMTELTLNDVKKFQLQILDEIDNYCTENSLTYFLGGGTLIGAIRHNGYIPWDDDIDIALLRDDYDNLLNNFQSKSGNVVILHNGNKEGYYWPSAKAIHCQTELIENNHSKCKIGVNIDIFPLDKVNGTRDECLKKVRKAIFWKNLLTLKYLQFHKRRTLYKNIIVLFGKILYIVKDSFLISQIEKIALEDKNEKDSKYVCNFYGAWGEKELVDISIFKKSIKHSFENREYSIPSEYDSYLSALYGDYMQLPPPEKRITHHNYIAYLKQ